MADFGSRNMGFFGGSTSGGGGSSTGVNGLNGTTNIGLGGTLSGNTQILGGGYDFVFSQAGSLVFEGSNVLGGANIGNYGNYIRLGAIDTSNNFSQLFVENEKIYTKFNSAEFGFYVEYDFGDTIRKSILGDYDDVFNQFKLIVDDINGFVKTTNADGDNGLIATSSYTQIGANNSTNNFYLSVDVGGNFISTFKNNIENGLSLDFVGKNYRIGGFNENNNYIQIDDTNNRITFETSNLTFTGAGLEDTNAPAGVGVTYLLVTLNNTQYSILCTETNL
jgi:hypothetical protein